MHCKALWIKASYKCKCKNTSIFAGKGISEDLCVCIYIYIYIYKGHDGVDTHTGIYCHLANSVLWYLHIRLVERRPSVKLYMMISTETLSTELFLSSPSLLSVFLIDTLSLNECEFVQSGCYLAATFSFGFLIIYGIYIYIYTGYIYCNFEM